MAKKPKEFEPLLAQALKTEKDFESLVFPVIATPKLDGIRALKKDGNLITRSNKLVRNAFIQGHASLIPDGLDGEIITYTDGVMDPFDTVSSKVMSGHGAPEFKFHVFDDYTNPSMPYLERLAIVRNKIANNPIIEYVETVTVHNLDELMELATSHTSDGWEGTMVRKPLGIYKWGRSSVKEGILLKIKKFEDDEATVVDITQKFSNQNPVEVNELGKNFRRSHKENMVPVEEMGQLHCVWKRNGIKFEVGTGFTDEQRKWWWENRENLIGTLITFKFFGVGANGKPRHPGFVGIRRDL